MTQPWPPEQQVQRPRRLGLGAGSLLGVLVGLLGPVLLALGAWGLARLFPGEPAVTIGWIAVFAILTIPVVLLLAGCLLMIPDHLRGWGVGALMASGVWLVCSAGVCTVAFFGALSTYENAAMMLP
ncbi:hypothetical protein [Janibacter sp. GS2]|uniref:hypothetical protein n=1 Tax=Janibacter sp. GS2 TaxID=3442646 RepID=UPI003EBB2533